VAEQSAAVTTRVWDPIGHVFKSRRLLLFGIPTFWDFNWLIWSPFYANSIDTVATPAKRL
jgi:hypothetical protein